jgi:hypothetical protein
MFERRSPCIPVLFLMVAALAACSSSAGGPGPSPTGGSGGSPAGGTGGANPGTGGANPGTGGTNPGTGGTNPGTGGAPDAAVKPDAASDGGAAAPDAPGAGSSDGPSSTFSFFLTSLEGMQRLARSPDGFGGNLTYGQADGISGADKICADLAESSLAGAGSFKWRAFLSAQRGPGGPPVNAIDRIGEGPWFDRVGRMMAASKADLLNTRPRGADPAIINDLPNEFGIPNHRPDPSKGLIDNHHVLTGSDPMGQLVASGTCDSWTSTAMTAGKPHFGFAWPMANRQHWISGGDESGCGAGIDVDGGGGPVPGNPVVGSGGGYGGIYCFRQMP